MLGPEQARVALAADHVFLVGYTVRDDVRVEFIGFAKAGIDGFVELVEAVNAAVFFEEMEACHDGHGAAGRDVENEMCGGLGAFVFRGDSFFFAVDEIAVEGVFGVRKFVFPIAKGFVIGVVFGEKPIRLSRVISGDCGVETEVAE